MSVLIILPLSPDYLNVDQGFDIEINKNMDRPKCGCGNTQNPDGYCDGSHLKNN